MVQTHHGLPLSDSWRDRARPIIAEAIRSCGYPKGCDEKFIRKVLRAEYPFEMREYWPYKVWCDEVRRQLAAAKAGCPRLVIGKIPTPDPRQLTL